VHLTVARRMRGDPGRPPFLPIDWQISNFSLLESVSDSDGVHYRALRLWNL